MQFIKNNYYLKKAAMFGIDARITLAVTAIVAFMVGINQFTEIGQNNIKSAKLDLQQIKTSFFNYYEDKYATPASVDDLITEKYLSFLQEYNLDPWGNAYQINVITNQETIENAIVEVKYITLISYGKNGVQDTANPTTKANWLTRQALNDDIILKFDTKEIEKNIIEIENSQLTIVSYLINNYISQKMDYLAGYCVTHQTNSNCDVDGDGTYEENEETQLNFMLKDIDDNVGDYYLTNHITYGTPAHFKSGYISATNANYNMYAFISQLGGSSILVTSPRNYTLHFTSNKYASPKAPYFAEVWYDVEQTSF